MYYEINVAQNNTHFFATAPRSITRMGDLQTKLKIFMEKFPENEGYIIMVSEIPETSRIMNIKKVLDDR